MADNVIKKMEKRQADEDRMIQQYEAEMERRQQALEEERQQKHRAEQQQMRDFLQKQVEEKRKREQDDQSNVNAQAAMWNVDKANWDVEEQRLKERINKINKEN